MKLLRLDRSAIVLDTILEVYIDSGQNHRSVNMIQMGREKPIVVQQFYIEDAHYAAWREAQKDPEFIISKYDPKHANAYSAAVNWAQQKGRWETFREEQEAQEAVADEEAKRLKE